MVEATITELIDAAGRGDHCAWNQIVARYMPLVIGTARKYRLFGQDADDVCQTVWLRLVEHLSDLRDARALPKWLATTTRNEALRFLNARKRTVLVDPIEGSELDTPYELEDVAGAILTAERQQALRDGLAELQPHQRELLLLLVADPPLSYLDISARLSIPIGSIGPTRARCLAKLRTSQAIRSLHSTETENNEIGGNQHDLTRAGRA